MDSSPKPALAALRDPGLTKAGSIRELEQEGFAVFTLAPVYVYGGVKENLCESFAGETGRDVRGTSVRFDRPVVARCEAWNYILDVMDAESFLYFKDWLMRLQLADSQGGRFYLVRHCLAPLLDPFALARTGRPVPATLNVFTLSGLKGFLKPHDRAASYAAAPLFVDFTRLPPEPDVVRIGTAALEALRGIRK